MTTWSSIITVRFVEATFINNWREKNPNVQRNVLLVLNQLLEHHAPFKVRLAFEQVYGVVCAGFFCCCCSCGCQHCDCSFLVSSILFFFSLLAVAVVGFWIVVQSHCEIVRLSHQVQNWQNVYVVQFNFWVRSHTHNSRNKTSGKRQKKHTHTTYILLSSTSFALRCMTFETFVKESPCFKNYDVNVLFSLFFWILWQFVDETSM